MVKIHKDEWIYNIFMSIYRWYIISYFFDINTMYLIPFMSLNRFLLSTNGASSLVEATYLSNVGPRAGETKFFSSIEM